MEEGTNGCRTYDIELPQYSYLSGFQFRNKCSYSISILFQSKGCNDWKVGLWEHVLMSNAHTGGKNYEKNIVLSRDVFLQPIEDVIRLRVIVKQPSPHWENCCISNFTFMCAEDARAWAT